MPKKLSRYEKNRREEAHRREMARRKSARRERTLKNEKERLEKRKREIRELAAERAAIKVREERREKEAAERKEKALAKKKAIKEAAEKDRIAEIQRQIRTYQEFTGTIVKLHKKFKPNPKFFAHLRDGKSPNGRFLNKLIKPEPKTFQPKEFDEITRMLGVESKYSFDKYCKSIAKVKNDLKGEIAQLELEASYTFDQFKDLNYSKLSIGRVLNARQKYDDYLLAKKIQLSKAKSKLSKLNSEYEEFKVKREKEYNERVLLHKQAEEQRSKEINDENKKNESEWLAAQTSQDKIRKNRIEWVDKIYSGDKDAIHELLSVLFPLKFELFEDEHEFLNSDPREIEIAYNITENHKMALLIELEPDCDFYPDNGVKLSPSGKNLVEFKVKEDDKKEKHKAVICSLALCYVNFIFTYLEMVNELVLEIVEPKLNEATGNYEDIIVLQLAIDRPAICSVNLEKVDPVLSVEHLGGNHMFAKKITTISSRIDEEKLLWLESDTYPAEIQDMEVLIQQNSILIN